MVSNQSDVRYTDARAAMLCMITVMNDPLRIVGLGEVLWDVYPDAARFGGAPANFACHAAALGADAAVISAVGSDELGREAQAILRQKHVRVDWLQVDPQRATGSVMVEISDGHPSYHFAANTAWDHVSWDHSLVEVASKCNAVCFGTLAQRSETTRATIHRFLQSTQPNCLAVFDVNLRQSFFNEPVIRQSLQLANVFKLSDEELPVVMQTLGLSASSIEDSLRMLAETFSLRVIALSRGGSGSLILADGVLDEQSPPAIDAIDTVGAGDSFTAAITMGLLRAEPIAVLHRRASDIAAYVCTQQGATPELPQSVIDSL